MSAVEFVRADDVPPEVWDAVEPLLLRHVALVPTWCHEVRVFWDSSDGETSAKCGADYEYRVARVTICGGFFDYGPAGRDEAIRHEFLHIPLCPLTDWTRDLIHRLTGDDTRLRDWLLSEWRERLEGAVCDLEKATR